jgi:CubicO group peptidase (beta-lactamase class C family)
MKRYFTIFALLSIYIYANSQVSNAVNGQDKENGVTEKQSELIFEKTKIFPNNTQISIAIIEKGVAKFYGVKRENDTIFTTNNYKSVFEIGSISKVFTSTLLANFVINHKVNLDSTISTYSKSTIKDDKGITFKELANHTSGLPRLPSNLNLLMVNPQNPYKDYDEKKLIEYLNTQLELSQSPGEKYGYSNLGVGLLGYLLSKIENTTYENLLQTLIASKYQMTITTTNRSFVENKLIKGLDYNGNEVSNWDFNILAGAGAILSNVDDLSKFAVAQFDNSNKELVITRETTFSINENMDIALGWHIIKIQSGDRWFWHNGGTGGYTSSMAIDTERKTGVIILSNVSAFNKEMGNIDNLCFELMKTLK